MLLSKENKAVNSIIGLSVRVEGDFCAEGDVVVDGIVRGSLRTNRDLRIGKEAEIFADVSAQSAFIAGKVKGNVKIGERLDIAQSAEIHGDIEARVLSVEPGAIIIGRCVIAPELPEGLAPEESSVVDVVEEVIVAEESAEDEENRE